MPRRTCDDLAYEGREFRRICLALYGPADGMVRRAARGLGCSSRMIQGIMSGEWQVPRRMLAVLEKIAEHRPRALDSEGQTAVERLRRSYQERVANAASARVLVVGLRECRRRQRMEPLP